MKGPAKENELARRSTEMNGRLPSSYDNKDYSKKRKPKNHKFSVKDPMMVIYIQSVVI